MPRTIATGVRVPRMTGLPSQMLGSITIRSGNGNGRQNLGRALPLPGSNLRTPNRCTEALQNHILTRFDKTLYQWREDLIRPKLLMGKLCRKRITVSEDDLRQMFEHLYGKKVRCKIIIWPKGEESVARKVYEEIRRSEQAFDRTARSQALVSLAVISRLSLVDRPSVSLHGCPR